MRRNAVDVVIPVYNAPELTRRCIDSLYAHVERQIERTVVYDDASSPDTARMLDSLSHPRLTVIHGETNVGFGAAVNRGVEHCNSPLVLVVNSDVEASSDFLSPLTASLRADPRLAAVSPGGNSFKRYEFSRYLRRSSCVITHRMRGHAFLIRRSIFRDLGGFDPLYGRGFFEDTDLSRRLLGAGWWIGIQPRSWIYHKNHGSFGTLDDFRDLMDGNRHKYYARYPKAATHVLLITPDTHLADLPRSLREEVEDVLRCGGEVHWLSPGGPKELPALEICPGVLGLLGGIRLLRRRRAKPYKRFREVWCVGGSPRFRTMLVRLQARQLGIRVRDWEAVRQPMEPTYRSEHDPGTRRTRESVRRASARPPKTPATTSPDLVQPSSNTSTGALIPD